VSFLPYPLESPNMTSVRLVLILVLAPVLSGCATIIGGTSQLLTVNANVAGAEVFFNDSLLGTTPLTARVQRGKEGILRVRAEGYMPYQIAVNKKISTLFWVNIFSGGSFGSSTDYSTGAMYEYEPSTFMVSLTRGGQSLDEQYAWQRREGLRGFVLHNGDALVSDLAVGKGEYIDVLVNVFSVTPFSRAQAIERWRSEYAASKTAAEFAERMVAQLDR